MTCTSSFLTGRYVVPVALLFVVHLLAGCGNENGVTGVATATQIATLDAASFATDDVDSPADEATPEPAPTDVPTPQSVTTESDTVDEDTEAITAGDGVTTTETMTEVVSAEMTVEAAVFFAQPTNYALLPITSTVVMSVAGLAIQPAGEVVEGAGHLHLLVDADFVPAGEAIAKDEQHLHFGDGSTEGLVRLDPGVHTLRLQFADGAHIALDGDQYRAEIEVTVAEDAAEQDVYFVDPVDGDVVTSPVDIIMGATGLIVEPAGVVRDGAGHMHILIDTDFIPVGEAVPKDETHRHFGGGQTSATLELEPGEHVLRLQYTNGAHIVLDGEQYQDEMTIVVEEP